MTHRITIKLQLPGKSRLIFNFSISSTAQTTAPTQHCVVEAWDFKRDVTNEKGLERVRLGFLLVLLFECCDIGQIILIEGFRS